LPHFVEKGEGIADEGKASLIVLVPIDHPRTRSEELLERASPLLERMLVFPGSGKAILIAEENDPRRVSEVEDPLLDFHPSLRIRRERRQRKQFS
jgi:hypothetical protein